MVLEGHRGSTYHLLAREEDETISMKRSVGPETSLDGMVD